MEQKKLRYEIFLKSCVQRIFKKYIESAYNGKTMPGLKNLDTEIILSFIQFSFP